MTRQDKEKTLKKRPDKTTTPSNKETRDKQDKGEAKTVTGRETSKTMRVVLPLPMTMRLV